MDLSFGTHDTSEAGVATNHVRASGQSHLQPLLFTGIALLALGGPLMVLPVLLVDPTICFICTKADRVDKDVISSLGPVTGKPEFPETLTGKNHFQVLPPTCG